MLIRMLRWSEQYTKTDMVYLAQAGWWTNLDLIIASFISLILSIVFANILPSSTYGLYQYLLSISALVSAVAFAGMNTAVAQAVSRGYEGVFKESIKEQARWAIVLTLGTLLIAIYYFFHGNFEVAVGLIAIAFFTPVINIFNTYGAFLQGKKEFRRSFYFSLVINLIYGLCIALAAFFLKNAVVLIFVNLGVNAATIFLVYRKTVAIYKPNTKIDQSAIPYGRHLSALSAWGTILTQLDSILIFHFLGPIDLAVYSFATLLPERIGSLFSFIGTAWLPKLANYELADIRRNIISKILRVMAAAIVVTILYIVVAPIIFKLLFPRYISAIYYTQIYSPIIILLAVINITSSTFFAKRLKREIYIIGLIQPALLVLLQLPLLLLYGIIGMLVARLATDLIGIILALFFTFYPISKNQQ